MAHAAIEERAETVARLLEVAEVHGATALKFHDDDEPAPTWRIARANDDIALVNAMLDVERSRRGKVWAALEALLPLIPPGGDVSELIYLPANLRAKALRLAMDCGWFWPPR